MITWKMLDYAALTFYSFVRVVFIIFNFIFHICYLKSKFWGSFFLLIVTHVTWEWPTGYRNFDSKKYFKTFLRENNQHIYKSQRSFWRFTSYPKKQLPWKIAYNTFGISSKNAWWTFTKYAMKTKVSRQK